MHQIQQFDTQIFLWLNGLHAPWADVVMHYITERDTWIPLYALIVFVLIRRYGRGSALLIACLILTVVIADQFTSSLLKPLVERLRPCHVAYLQDKIHTVDGCGGLYGFASSHAANSFGLATALWLLFGRSYGWLRWFFAWAAVVSYSRVYVGAHYPLDIIAGGLIGAAAAWIAVWGYRQIAANKIM